MLDRMLEWWERRSTWQKAVTITVVVVVLVGPFVSEEPEAPQDASSQEAAFAQGAGETSSSGADPELISEPGTSTPQTSPASTSTSSTGTTQAPLPGFKIVEERDLSFAGANRIMLRVTVESGAGREELRAIASLVSTRYRDSDQYQALTIAFYHYPELAGDVPALGMWEDAPFGDWGRANEVSRGDYSQNEVVDKTKEKDWSVLPSREEVDLYVAFNEMFDSMDDDPLDVPSDDEVFAAVAAERGVSPEDVYSAADAVLDWMFNEQ